MSTLEFKKLVHCFCFKRTIKVNSVVDPSAICFISLGSTKQVDIKIKGVLITVVTYQQEKRVLNAYSCITGTGEWSTCCTVLRTCYTNDSLKLAELIIIASQQVNQVFSTFDLTLSCLTPLKDGKKLNFLIKMVTAKSAFSCRFL